mmetsp:Transcript_20347/g.32454  ORF Transcript_20347/g.32454 Transcript_20347/m.32454 type:complete len:159 (-) Transcript_20347:107-583(-)
MARVGVANYALSTDNTVKQDKYWREGLERAQRDHNYSAFNEPFPKSSYAYINTTSNDFLSRTWQVLNSTRSVAAGKTSFHNNVAKPQGAITRNNQASASFDSNRHHDRTAPPRSPFISAASQGVLHPSMSAPSLSHSRYADDNRSVASSRRSRRSQFA